MNFLIRFEDNRDPGFRRSKVVTIHSQVINIIERPLREPERAESEVANTES